MSFIVQINNLVKQYAGSSEPAVKGISFGILEGEIFSLLGPNGAGKTTIISILSTLIQATSGDAEICGYSVMREPMVVKNLIGIIPQELALYLPLTARQNLRFWGQMYGMGGKALAEHIDEVLVQVNLSERADEKVEKYSGGMMRRLNIAIGLLHKPKLIFMDEPTVGIDPQSRRNILDMVKDLCAQGMTVLYTTHYMEEAAELSDRVGIIDHGKLIALGTQKDITKLVGEQETLRLHFGDEESADGLLSHFQGLSSVLSAVATDHQIVLTVPSAEDSLPAVISTVSEVGVHVRSIDIEEPNLEAVFLKLTGRGLRD